MRSFHELRRSLRFYPIICRARGSRKGRGPPGESEAGRERLEQGPPQAGCSRDPGLAPTPGAPSCRLAPLIGDSNLVQAKRPPQCSGPLTTRGPPEAAVCPFTYLTHTIVRESVPPTSGSRDGQSGMQPRRRGGRDQKQSQRREGDGPGSPGWTKPLFHCVRDPVSHVLDFFLWLH